MPRSRRKSKSTTSQVAAQPSPLFTCWENCTWRTQVTAGASISVWDENRDSDRIKCPGYVTEPLVVVCVHRAIIIRNNEILPMSSEFTPESERQRLQFLVSDLRNFVCSEASHRIGGECFFLSLRRRNCKYLDIWNNGIAGLDMRWLHQSLFKLSEFWLRASHRIYKPTSDMVPSIRRALCSHTCWETSSHTWNFPAESRGKRWAERCSTEISPWTDGKSLFLSLCLIFRPWSWRWAWMAWSTERPANVTWPASPASPAAASVPDECILYGCP